MTSTKKHLIPTLVVAATAYLIYENYFRIIPSPIVNTSTGKVRGTVALSREGRTYHQFLGIPYAKPPVGSLRFEDPEPITPWDGVYNAYDFGAECLQLEVLILGRVVGNENCLFLNVYTPKLDDLDRPLPVMVYVHGGLFMGGSSNMYRGRYIMDEDVILVTLNYRVAALGFLATGDGLIRGNQGLKDQSLALQWVYQNIKSFGGDPERITLFGESAGGASVHYQMLSKQPKGLFQKVISMSGTAVRKYTTTDRQDEQLLDFGNKFGCNGGSSKEILECVKRIDGATLVEAHREASDALPKNKNALFVPVVEVVNDTRSFLAENPRSLIQTGKFGRIPWMTGVVAYEGLLYVARIVREPEAVKMVNENWRETFPKLLKIDPKKTGLIEKIKKFYFGNAEKLDILNNVERFSDLFSDRLFIHPTFQAAKWQSKHSPVYLYYLSYKPLTSAYQLITSITPNGKLPPPLEYLFSQIKRWIMTQVLQQEYRTYGPSHGDELSLIFDMHFLALVKQDHVDYQFSRNLIKILTSFAKDEKTMTFNGHLWPAVNSEDSMPGYLELSMDGSYHLNPSDSDLAERMKFWDALDEPYN